MPASSSTVATSSSRPPGESSATTLRSGAPVASRTGALVTFQIVASRTGGTVAAGSATTIQVTNDASVSSVRRATSRG